MGGADAGSESALIAFGSPDEQADLPEELTEIDDDSSGGDGVLGTGAVSGGFGFAGLALAVVSLTTNWTSGVVVSHGQYSAEVHAPSSGLTAQQQLNLAANGWHTQGWWALVFAAAAVLSGAGALLWPRVLHSGGTPGWLVHGGHAATTVSCCVLKAGPGLQYESEEQAEPIAHVLGSALTTEFALDSVGGAR